MGDTITVAGLLAASAIAALLISNGTPARAQGGFAGGIADPGSMDALSGASTGPSGGYALDRARDVAGGGSDPFAAGPADGGDPFGGGAAPGGDPFGGGAAPGGDPFGGAGGPPGGEIDPAITGGDPFGGAGGFGGDPFGGAGGFGGDPFGGAGGFGGQPGGGFNIPQIPEVKAIYGTRVICHVTGEMLDDAYEVSILESFKDSYHDDGKTGMDYKAGDLTWTDVKQDDTTYMSAEAHLVKTRLIQGLRKLEDLPTNVFSGSLVLSAEPLTEGVATVVEKEEEKDKFLESWSQKFLQDFRVDPAKAERAWDFYQTYLPPPPVPPDRNVPSNFYPPFVPQETAAATAATAVGPNGQVGPGGAGGAPLPPGATAAIGNAFGANNIQANPGASSSYFGGAAASGK